MAEAQMQSATFAFGREPVDDLSDEEAEILDAGGGRIVLFHIEGPLSFGSARDISRMMQRSMAREVLLVDLSDVPLIDSSAAMALEEVITELREINDTVMLFGVRERVL